MEEIKLYSFRVMFHKGRDRSFYAPEEVCWKWDGDGVLTPVEITLLFLGQCNFSEEDNYYLTSVQKLLHSNEDGRASNDATKGWMVQ